MPSSHFLRRFFLLLALIPICATIGGKNQPISPQDSLALSSYHKKIEQFEKEGRRDSLIVYYRKQAVIFEKNDLLSDWVGAYVNLFYTNLPLTLSYLDSMETARWRSPENTAEAGTLFWAYVSHGYYLIQYGAVHNSIDAYKKALALFSTYPALKDSIGAESVLEYVYKPLGNNYTRIGDNQQAVNIIEKAVNLAEPLQNADLTAGLYNNLGTAYWNQYMYGKAIDYYQKGLKASNLPKDKRALLLSSLARVYYEKGQNELALKTVNQAVALVEELIKVHPKKNKHLLRWASKAKMTLGLLYNRQANFALAEKTFKEALMISLEAHATAHNREIGKIYIQLGNIYQKLKNPEKALAYHNKALSSVIPLFRPTSIRQNPLAGQFNKENTIFEALEAKALAFQELFKNDKDPNWLKLGLHCHELAYEAEKLLWEAYQYQSSKLLLQADSRRRSEKAIAIAFELFEQSKDSLYLEKAYGFAEQSKSIILLDAIKENLALQEVNRGDSLFLKEREMKRWQAYFESQILQAEQTAAESGHLNRLKEYKKGIDEKLSALVSQIENKYPAYKAVKALPGHTSIKEVQKKILNSPASLLIEYFEGEDNIYVFTISGEGKAGFYKLPRDKELKTLIASFLEKFKLRNGINNDPASYTRLAQRLFLAIYGNVAKLDKKQLNKVVIVPDGSLSYLPFEALIVDASGSTNPGTADYLLRYQQIHYAYSASVLFKQASLGHSNKKAFLGVAPLFLQKERQLSPLRYSEEEVRKIAEKIGGSNLLIGEKASLDRFRKSAPQYQIIHLSTHALVDSGGLPPRIEFIDSSLFLPELYGMNLQAELVVLSSCQSGLGQFRKGEGLMSLARGFTYAGASSLISSLWNANDAATATLFQDFYALLRKGESKALALHKAKLAYLDNPSISNAKKSPYYWAGFVLIGSDNVMELRSRQHLKYILLAFMAVFVLFFLLKRFL